MENYNSFDMNQKFLNIHFKSSELANFLNNNNLNAMLTFCYNKQVSVMINHNLKTTGNFVIQIPILQTEMNDSFAQNILNQNLSQISDFSIENVN